MEREISIYDEVMESLYISNLLDEQEKMLIEKYKALYFIRFEYIYIPNKIKNIKELKKLKDVESEMDKIIATEIIQKMLQEKRKEETEKWKSLGIYENH